MPNVSEPLFFGSGFFSATFVDLNDSVLVSKLHSGGSCHLYSDLCFLVILDAPQGEFAGPLSVVALAQPRYRHGALCTLCRAGTQLGCGPFHAHAFFAKVWVPHVALVISGRRCPSASVVPLKEILIVDFLLKPDAPSP